jgi:hypothetical protein
MLQSESPYLRKRDSAQHLGAQVLFGAMVGAVDEKRVM